MLHVAALLLLCRSGRRLSHWPLLALSMQPPDMLKCCHAAANIFQNVVSSVTPGIYHLFNRSIWHSAIFRRSTGLGTPSLFSICFFFSSAPLPLTHIEFCPLLCHPGLAQKTFWQQNASILNSNLVRRSAIALIVHARLCYAEFLGTSNLIRALRAQ